MELSFIILKQLILMLLFSLIGYFLSYKKIITMQGCKELANLLLMIVIPFVILNSFMVEKTRIRSEGLLISIMLSIVSFGISMGLSYLIYNTEKGIECFSSAFSNAGFIGIPLVQATLGHKYVFYISAYVAFLNIFQWIYGVFVITGDKKEISIFKILKNPVLDVFFISLIIYFLQLNRIPYLKDVAQSFAAMNTPLAMIIIGIYMSKIDVIKMFLNKNVYLCSLVRLLIIPMVTLFVYRILPMSNQNITLAVLIVSSAPVGANVAMFAQIFKKDYTFAVEIVVLSTILSVITLPCIVYITQILFGNSFFLNKF